MVAQKKILLLGASGQLGAEVKFLLKDCVDLKIINRQEIDFSKEFALDELGDFDRLINCMALTDTGYCEEHPEEARHLNGKVLGILGEYCHTKKAKIIHISTDYVFSGDHKRPYREQDKAMPKNIYGASKLMGEKLLALATQNYLILRVASLFGAYGKNGNIIETIIQRAKQQRKVALVADQFMSPTHTLDIANIIEADCLDEMKLRGIFHCTTEGGCSWYEFGKFILDTLQIECEIGKVSLSDFPSKLERPINGVLSTRKISDHYIFPTWKQSVLKYLGVKGYIK